MAENVTNTYVAGGHQPSAGAEFLLIRKTLLKIHTIPNIVCNVI